MPNFMSSSRKSESRDSTPSRPIFERLYSASERKIAAGKERRSKIEKSLAIKNQPHEFSDKKIPLSQATEFYNKSVKHAIEKEGKLAASALERDRSFKAQFNFTEDLQQKVGAMRIEEVVSRLRQSSNPNDSKIPVAQAEEFYYRAVRYAKERDDKLAAKAFERDRSYEAQFNFNEDLQMKSGAVHLDMNLSTVQEEHEVKKMSLHQSDEFYYKAVMRAIEKDERLAATALERDRSYKAQFKFNADALREN